MEEHSISAAQRAGESAPGPWQDLFIGPNLWNQLIVLAIGWQGMHDGTTE